MTPQSYLSHVLNLGTGHAQREKSEYTVLSLFFSTCKNASLINHAKQSSSCWYSLSFQKLERVFEFHSEATCQCRCLGNGTKPLACWKRVCHILKWLDVLIATIPVLVVFNAGINKLEPPTPNWDPANQMSRLPDRTATPERHTSETDSIRHSQRHPGIAWVSYL